LTVGFALELPRATGTIAAAKAAAHASQTAVRLLLILRLLHS
jgi:hypothetical protein